MSNANIRPECLAAAQSWTPPTGDEIKAVLALAEFSGADAAALLGLGLGGGRTVRRWTAGETAIPYAAWALLCHAAGLGIIWI
ncbi:MAG: transcriptional regulator [Thiobacillus sp.]|nr:transcriptional regulator [Thiobacillus sp.]